MITDLRFFIRYWRKNKRELFSVLVSAILLAVMITVSGYLERTEIRHELYTYYDADGAFDIEYKNADAEVIRLVEESVFSDCS